MSNQKRVEVDLTVDHEDVLVANLHHSCITTDRSIKLEDLDVNIENLPKGSRKLLRHHVLPEVFVRPYQNIITQAQTFFARYGGKTEIGVVFDHSRGRDLMEKMAELQKDLHAQLAKDKVKYEELARKHLEAIASEPEVRAFPHKDRLLELLKQRQPTWDSVEERITLDYTMMLVGSSKKFDADLYGKMQDSIVAIKKGAYGNLIQELCRIARRSLDAALKAPNERVHKRTVDAVWHMVEKLNELGFLDKRLRVVEKELRRYMQPLIQGEALRGADYEDFINLMVAFSNQHWVTSKLNSNEPIVEIIDVDEPGDLVEAEPAPVEKTEPETSEPEVSKTEDVVEASNPSEDTNVESAPQPEKTDGERDVLSNWANQSGESGKDNSKPSQDGSFGGFF
ncbi:DUF3150 domain-containing protein [Marinobacter sp.]|jgi:hypothetical protein|uniref:DUF3150 domain-containing protein n=1 Tax=Marinobacter sp. TaxID=50741 RepID=UPI002627915C|nr:DUF3150 domain-containing protein [Marinobacter sp.]|eukprot:TRINITY_DN93403_c0_g1_i1.p1 TRINITY_DN93403_c0_g1~~TRINITY_DN93403_c0_g1_i1.p1  ORF type:complete len:396 (+),score=52.09 TRINITY_DN93403_c0_g1_i1:212-1399(+)